MAVRDWRVVGERVAVERGRHWSRPEFAALAGISRRVLEDLETGIDRNYSPDTLGKIERALRWEPGSAYRIAEGLQPRYEDGPELRAILDAWPDLDDKTRRVLAAIAEAFARE